MLNKIVGVTLGVLTVDSWRLAKIDQNRAKAQSDLSAEIDKLKQSGFYKDMTDMGIKTKVEAIGGRIQESQGEIDSLTKKANFILDQLNKSGLQSQNKEQLFSDLTRTLDRKTELVNKVSDEVKNINDTFTKKKDLFGFIDDFIVWYKEFLSNISVEQLGCLSNIIGFSIIFMALNSIIIIYFGNNIINSLNLESKYPKLAKFIQIRRKILDKYIKFHIVYIYVTSIVFICINIYMFFL